jgi:hydroxymethylbilane synthase
LLERRDDLEVVDIRGNVDTRLAKVASGEFDAIVLAAAGLDRLGRLDEATEIFGIESWPTAPGQGALAVEVRSGNESLVAKLNHGPSKTAVDAEREVLATLEAGCSAPIAANAFIDDGLLFLSARVYSADGAQRLTSSHALYVADSPTPALDVADRVATELLAGGAADLAPLGASS